MNSVSGLVGVVSALRADYSYLASSDLLSSYTAGDPVGLQSFGYAYDLTTPRWLRRTRIIGNRTSVTSASSVVNYSPNNLKRLVLRSPNLAENRDGVGYKQLTSTNDTEAQYPLIKVVGVAKILLRTWVTPAGQDAATNGDDIVTIETGHVFVAKNPEQFTYDEDGNLLSDGRWEYTCPSVDGSTLRCENGDPTSPRLRRTGPTSPRLRRTGNRLVSMETATNKVGTTVPVVRLEFVYDYQGRRASKTVYSWSGTNWTEESESTFIYDSWNLVSETCDIQTLGLSTNLYVWGLDLSGSLQGAGGIGGLLFRSDGGTTSVSSVSYVFDANGNVSELLTDTGEIAAHYVEAERKSDCRRKYDPYGNTLVSEGELASDNVYRFSTKYTDTETKLLYYGCRYYSPSMGRWPSRDPIGEEDGAGLYCFIRNSPVFWWDADGRAAGTRC